MRKSIEHRSNIYWRSIGNQLEISWKRYRTSIDASIYWKYIENQLSIYWKSIESLSEGSELITEGSEPITECCEPTTEGYEPITEGSEPITEGSEPITVASEPKALNLLLNAPNITEGSDLIGSERIAQNLWGP